ncbi:MAG: 2-phospho-L-lactate guanylyltransferase [Actinomycetota bacterium]
MRICIVPMKPLAHAKARLAEVLSPDERRELSLAMLTDVIRAARALDAVWVLNSDEEAAAVADAEGAEARPDPAPGEGLNPSVDAAAARAISEGATGVLVLSADCPAARQEDVKAVAFGNGVVISPNRYGTGTNALWRSPPLVIQAAFGGNSLRSHVAIAHVNNVPFAVVPRARLALDVDRPRDLDDLWALGPGDATRAAMERLGYPSRRR